MRFTKYKNNPILKCNENNSWESLCVLNPAVIYNEQEKTFYMMYRAAGKDDTHYIYLGLASSKDGFNFTRLSDKPVLAPDVDNCDGGCIEDPRLVKMGDWYYLTYASRPYAPGCYWRPDWKPFGENPEFGPSFLKNNATLTHLAISKDLRKWKKLGRITDSRYDDRDVIIFPEKVNGKFVKLSRAMEWCGEGYPNKNPAIWISYSDDLMEWGEHTLLMQGEYSWENKKIGGSTPPLKTDKGWLMIYHGVSKEDNAYRVGVALLDLNNPSKILKRSKDFIMEPELIYETSGYYNGCVFPTGNVIVEGTLYLYYGAADKFVCVATANMNELMKYLIEEC